MPVVGRRLGEHVGEHREGDPLDLLEVDRGGRVVGPDVLAVVAGLTGEQGAQVGRHAVGGDVADPRLVEERGAEGIADPLESRVPGHRGEPGVGPGGVDARPGSPPSPPATPRSAVPARPRPPYGAAGGSADSGSRAHPATRSARSGAPGQSEL